MLYCDPYDGENIENSVVWKKLPFTLRNVIISIQGEIQNEVERKNPGLYRPVSGWRSDSANRSCGGVVNSAHLWGFARDFIQVDGRLDKPPLVCNMKYKIVKSKNCWHIEVRNG